MYQPNPNKFSQLRYFLSYKKRQWYIIANYEAPGQSKAMSLCLHLQAISLYYLWNVRILNLSNQENTYLQFFQVDKGNMFRVSWITNASTTKESISIFKCTKPMSLPSFRPFAVYSNSKSTSLSVYHIFINPPRINENINRQSKVVYSQF
jgi:hypothetical protein